MGEGNNNENIIRQLQLDADIAAAVDADRILGQVRSSSKEVIDRMTHNYDFSRAVVENFTYYIEKRLRMFEYQNGSLGFMQQAQIAAIEGFNEALDTMMHRGHDPKAMHVYERWRREYEEELRTSLK